jgi:predicted adenine nucleotide alpha hydrolase (AANH) superfamily ATPase
MATLLLQVCCAPDATYGVEYFKDSYDVTIFFHNPNVEPEDEYKLRCTETLRVSHRSGVRFREGPYDNDAWHQEIQGLEDEPEGGKRCHACIRFRLERAAAFAKARGFDAVSTVLTVSPKKDARAINRMGEEIAKRHGLIWAHADLKKREGFKRSLELSKEMEIYRQNYCGCEYSLRERHKKQGGTPMKIKTSSLQTPKARPPGRRGERLLLKETRMSLEELGYETFEERFTFLGWRPLRATVRCRGTEFEALPVVYSGSTKGIVRSKASPNGNLVLFDEMTFEGFRLEKGGVEIYARTGGEAIPLFLGKAGSTAPRVVVGPESLEALNQGDARFEVEIETEFDPAARSSHLLARKGDDADVLVYANLDTLYHSPGANFNESGVAGTLQLAGRLKGTRNEKRVGFAFLGAYEYGLGSAPILKRRSDIELVIGLRGIGRGDRLVVSCHETLTKRVKRALDGFPFDSEIREVTGAIPLVQIGYWPDPHFFTPTDTGKTLDAKRMAYAIRLAHALIKGE